MVDRKSRGKKEYVNVCVFATALIMSPIRSSKSAGAEIGGYVNPLVPRQIYPVEETKSLKIVQSSIKPAQRIGSELDKYGHELKTNILTAMLKHLIISVVYSNPLSFTCFLKYVHELRSSVDRSSYFPTIHRDPYSKRTHRLQDVSSKTKEASKTSGGADNGTVSTSAERWLGDSWAGSADWNNWVGRGSVVGVCWSRSLGAGLADHNWGNLDWLCDSARAVGDGQGGGLSDCVGLVVEGHGSGLRAVGGVGGVNLSDIGDVAVGSDSGHEGSGDGSVRELHLDGVFYLLWRVKKRVLTIGEDVDEI